MKIRMTQRERESLYKNTNDRQRERERYKNTNDKQTERERDTKI